MTVTDLPPCPASEPSTTPQSQNLATLREALEDPNLIGFRWEIRDAIERLTGVRPEVHG